MTTIRKNLGNLSGRSSYFEHSFGEHSLHARILHNDNNEAPWVLSVHGARSDYAKSDAVTVDLRDRGYSILGFNMSGHSAASEIPVEQTKLDNNVEEAMAFYTYLDPHRKKKIIAHSLGSAPALKTIGEHIDQVDKVVLFGPAVYSAQAYDKHFGEEFRRVVSTPFSYRDNDVIPILEAYQGELLIVRGEYDGLDPVAYGKSSCPMISVINKSKFLRIIKCRINCNYNVRFYCSNNPKYLFLQF